VFDRFILRTPWIQDFSPQPECCTIKRCLSGACTKAAQLNSVQAPAAANPTANATNPETSGGSWEQFGLKEKRRPTHDALEFGGLGGVGYHSAFGSAPTISFSAFGAFGGNHALYLQATFQLAFFSSVTTTELGLFIGYRGYFNKGPVSVGFMAGFHPQLWLASSRLFFPPDSNPFFVSEPRSARGLGVTFGPILKFKHFYGQIPINVQYVAPQDYPTDGRTVLSMSLAAGVVF
jgi:hypothetical protein